MFLGSCSSSLSSSLPLSWFLCETDSPLTSVRWLQLYCLTDRRAVDLEELSFRNPSTGPESHFEVPTLDGSLPLRFTLRVDEDSDLSLMLPPGYTE